MPSFFAPDYVHLTRHQDDSRATLASATSSLEASDEGTMYTIDDASTTLTENVSATPVMDDGAAPRRHSRAVGHAHPQHVLVEDGAPTGGGDPSVFVRDFRKNHFWRQRTKLEKALLLLVLVCLIGFFGVVLILATSTGTSSHQGPQHSTSPQTRSTDGNGGRNGAASGGGSSNDDTIPICSTSGCVKAAANLLSSVDTTVDPCDNFFDYACGQWNRDHPIPDDMPGYGTFGYVRDIVRQQLRTILESADNYGTESRAITMSRNLYKNCLNTTWINSLKSEPILAAMREFYEWPLLNPKWSEENRARKLNLTDVLGRMRRDYSLDIFINLYVYADARNTTNNIMTIDQGALGLGPGTRDYYLNDTLYALQMRAYQRYITALASLISADAGKPLDEARKTWLRAQTAEIINFERQLANISSAEEQRRNHTLLYNKWTVQKLKETVTAIDWDAYFKLIMPKEVAKTVKSNMVFIVSEPEYMRKLNTILLNTDQRILANYVIWRLVKGWAKLLDNRYDDAFQVWENIDFCRMHPLAGVKVACAADFVYIMMGRQQKPVRWKVCVPAAVGWMEMAAGALYVRAYFNEDDKREALAMIADLRLAFKTLVKKLDWMDDATKQFSMEKVEAMLPHIGYPDYVLNDTLLDEYYAGLKFDVGASYFDQGKMVSQYLQQKEVLDLLKPFDRNRFDTSPAIVNAFYSPEKNAITFPAGILQPPFFKGDYPKSINYGAMGAVIGHEITHGFDDQGSQYDKNGNLFDWWSPTAAEGFKQRTQCIVDQYNGYVVPEVNARVNGRLTQGENIADNGGVKEAFMAYRHYIARAGAEEPRLPGLQNLTNDQIFFLSYAHFWCGHKKPAAALQQALTDPHSPEMYRVMGVLSNLDEFAQAFACPSGTNMNPAPRVRRKCTVW